MPRSRDKYGFGAPRRRGLETHAKRISEATREALDPTRAPGPVRRWKDMTPEEQAAIRKLYERSPDNCD